VRAACACDVIGRCHVPQYFIIHQKRVIATVISHGNARVLRKCLLRPARGQTKVAHPPPSVPRDTDKIPLRKSCYVVHKGKMSAQWFK
jgi:hypothetical protein